MSGRGALAWCAVWALCALCALACGARTSSSSAATSSSSVTTGGAGAAVADGGAGGAVDPATAPSPLTVCVAGDPRGPFNHYDEPRTLQGDNGTYADACDASGNLVSYQCEEQDVGCPDRRGDRFDKHAQAPCLERTGKVLAVAVNCDGRCKAGACARRCPQYGDQVTIVALDTQGNAVFSNAADPRRFACTLHAGRPRSRYDCVNDPKVGDSFAIAGLGMSTTMCTGGTWGAISNVHCTYTNCHFVD